MSNGSKIIPVRIPAELLAEIEAEITRSEHTRSDTPYDMSSFIRKAIVDKLAHSKRSRSKCSKDTNEKTQSEIYNEAKEYEAAKASQ